MQLQLNILNNVFTAFDQRIDQAANKNLEEAYPAVDKISTLEKVKNTISTFIAHIAEQKENQPAELQSKIAELNDSWENIKISMQSEKQIDQEFKNNVSALKKDISHLCAECLKMKTSQAKQSLAEDKESDIEIKLTDEEVDEFLKHTKKDPAGIKSLASREEKLMDLLIQTFKSVKRGFFGGKILRNAQESDSSIVYSQSILRLMLFELAHHENLHNDLPNCFEPYVKENEIGFDELMKQLRTTSPEFIERILFNTMTEDEKQLQTKLRELTEAEEDLQQKLDREVENRDSTQQKSKGLKRKREELQEKFDALSTPVIALQKKLDALITPFITRESSIAADDFREMASLIQPIINNSLAPSCTAVYFLFQKRPFCEVIKWAQRISNEDAKKAAIENLLENFGAHANLDQIKQTLASVPINDFGRHKNAFLSAVIHAYAREGEFASALQFAEATNLSKNEQVFDYVFDEILRRDPKLENEEHGRLAMTLAIKTLLLYKVCRKLQIIMTATIVGHTDLDEIQQILKLPPNEFISSRDKLTTVVVGAYIKQDAFRLALQFVYSFRHEYEGFLYFEQIFQGILKRDPKLKNEEHLRLAKELVVKDSNSFAACTRINEIIAAIAETDPTHAFEFLDIAQEKWKTSSSPHESDNCLSMLAQATAILDFRQAEKLSHEFKSDGINKAESLIAIGKKASEKSDLAFAASLFNRAEEVATNLLAKNPLTSFLIYNQLTNVNSSQRARYVDLAEKILPRLEKNYLDSAYGKLAVTFACTDVDHAIELAKEIKKPIEQKMALFNVARNWPKERISDLTDFVRNLVCDLQQISSDTISRYLMVALTEDKDISVNKDHLSKNSESYLLAGIVTTTLKTDLKIAEEIALMISNSEIKKDMLDKIAKQHANEH